MSRVLVALLWLGPYPVAGQGGIGSIESLSRVEALSTDRVGFRHLTIEDGLSQNAVHALLQDRRGFVWIGTKDGLNRYDGYTFAVYRNAPENPSSLPGNHITTLLEGDGETLWVGTRDGGMGRLDRSTGTVQRYARSPRYQISAFATDAQGDLWVGTVGGGVFRLARSEFGNPDAVFDPVARGPTAPAESSLDVIRDLLIDPQGNVWVATEFGIERYTSDGAYIHIPFRVGSINGVDEHTVTSLFKDREGHLWAGSYGGISQLELAGQGATPQGPFRHYLYPAEQRGEERFPVGQIVAGPEGFLWQATLRGLRRFDPDTRTYATLQPNPLDPKSLSGEGISTVLWDRTGVLWAGVNGYGLNLYDSKAARFQTIRRSPDPSSRIDGFSVRAIHEDASGALWVSAGVLYRFDPTTGAVTSFDRSPENPMAFGNAAVWSFHEDASGTLWVGSTEGLYRRSPSGAVRRYAQVSGGASTGLPEQAVYGVFADREGTLWVVTGHYLSRLDDADAGRFTHFVHTEPESADGLGHAEAFFPSVHESADGLFWMATEKGLVRFDPRTSDVHRYRADPASSTRLKRDQVRTICPDPRDPDVLWLGTAGGGMARFDRRTDTFQHITEADGLPNNVVYGILPDASGQLWLSTNRGIARYDPETGTIDTYDSRDGLQSNEFNSGAYHRAADGRLFFGGIHGISAFDPEAIAGNPHVPAVVLTELRIGNRPVAAGDSTGLIDRELWASDELRLSHRENMVMLSFAALDYSAPEKNRYAYQMEGFDEDWIEAGTNRTATYTNLPPGRYTFRVRASNNDGLWNETGTSLEIRVAAPWWRTGWAYGLYGLVLLGGMATVYRVRQNRLQMQHQLELEHVEAEQLRQLDHAKSAFFANVSHELRTPLTLTLGPLDDVLAGEQGAIPEPASASLQMAQRSARRVLGLINQMLDVARLEAGQTRLRAQPFDLAAFARAQTDAFAALAAQKHITTDVLAPDTPVEVYADPEHLGTILSNLLSNAYKFTPDQGSVRVRIDTTGDDGETGTARVSVRDSGPGIPAADLPHVFDRFYQVRSPRRDRPLGTGIGLALAHELAALHSGTLTVESEEGFGSSFTLILPLGHAHLDPEQIGEAPPLAPHAPPPQTTGGDGQATDRQPEAPAHPDDDGSADVPTVLVVEDHPDIRGLVRTHLEREGYRVVEAPDGEAGLDKARQLVPDLILSDVMMPKMDGLALCRALKADPTTDFIPVILLTARAAPEDRLEGLREYAEAYLVKPFDPAELVARIETLIAVRTRLRERFRSEGIALVMGDDSAPTGLHAKAVEVTDSETEFLERVREAIEANLEDPTFTVQRLADAVGVSRGHLHRQLVALTEQTPSEATRTMRLERAAQLLAAGAGTVSEVAYAAGFKSVSHFSTRFSAFAGCPPSMYRDRMHEPDRAQGA